MMSEFLIQVAQYDIWVNHTYKDHETKTLWNVLLVLLNQVNSSNTCLIVQHVMWDGRMRMYVTSLPQ
jgi:hypothetical protein